MFTKITWKSNLRLPNQTFAFTSLYSRAWGTWMPDCFCGLHAFSQLIPQAVRVSRPSLCKGIICFLVHCVLPFFKLNGSFCRYSVFFAPDLIVFHSSVWTSLVLDLLLFWLCLLYYRSSLQLRHPWTSGGINIRCLDGCLLFWNPGSLSPLATAWMTHSLDFDGFELSHITFCGLCLERSCGCNLRALSNLKRHSFSPSLWLLSSEVHGIFCG